jgi:hypothetical protein
MPACVACLLAVFAASSCSSAPVDHVIYRACCGTENRWLGKQWHLTAAEAEAQVELHRREHPEHAVTSLSTAGPLRDNDVADAPLELRGFARDLVFRRDR